MAATRLHGAGVHRVRERTVQGSDCAGKSNVPFVLP